jgi:hypothetical protein
MDAIYLAVIVVFFAATWGIAALSDFLAGSGADSSGRSKGAEEHLR